MDETWSNCNRIFSPLLCGSVQAVQKTARLAAWHEQNQPVFAVFRRLARAMHHGMKNLIRLLTKIPAERKSLRRHSCRQRQFFAGNRQSGFPIPEKFEL